MHTQKLKICTQKFKFGAQKMEFLLIPYKIGFSMPNCAILHNFVLLDVEIMS